MPTSICIEIIPLQLLACAIVIQGDVEIHIVLHFSVLKIWSMTLVGVLSRHRIPTLPGYPLLPHPTLADFGWNPSIPFREKCVSWILIQNFVTEIAWITESCSGVYFFPIPAVSSLSPQNIIYFYTSANLRCGKNRLNSNVSNLKSPLTYRSTEMTTH